MQRICSTFASNQDVINSAGGWKLLTDINKAKAKIKSYIKRAVDEWAIALKKDSGFKIIGSIGMHKSAYKNESLCFDFGYLIAKEYWGQGIAAEAALKIMNYAFISLKCDVMTVSHKVFNMRSKRVIDKCKFIYRGIYPKHSPNNPDSKACYYLTREENIRLFDISETDKEYENINRSNKYLKKCAERSGQSQKQPEHIKGSPYSLKNPIRKIDSITYIKEPTGFLCGQPCVAMLADVPVDDVIEVIGTDKGTKKEDLKKALRYYGISYAPKSTKYDSNTPLPELCIIRMKLPKYGHWGIYYKGVYYDPEFGVLNNCPSTAKIFQVWEIYTNPTV